VALAALAVAPRPGSIFGKGGGVYGRNGRNGRGRWGFGGAKGASRRQSRQPDANAKMQLWEMPDDLLRKILPRVKLPFALKLTCRSMRALLPRRTKSFFSQIGRSVSLLRWAIDECGMPTGSEQVAITAVSCGRFSVLQELWDRDLITWNANMSETAARHGRLTMLKLARNKRFAWKAGTLRGAAEGGRLDIIKWAVEAGCKPSTDGASMYRLACLNGHVEVVKWLREWVSTKDLWAERYLDLCAVAASRGQIEVLAFLRTPHKGKVSPWSAEACAMAAANGHLDTLKYLRDNNCPWDKRVVIWAEANKDATMQKYASDNNCPTSGPPLSSAWA
jgi:hypothetical protein